jgi:5-formyltetrahydrofolate cyclo-ligase
MTDMTKADLRRAARTQRQAFLKSRGSALFALADDGAARLQQLLPAGACVAGYLAMGSEADPSALLQSLHDAGYSLSLPWIGADGITMVFRAWTPDAPVELAAARFSQPMAHAAEQTPDVILMPLLGYDRTGNRLGQGAGHYDRALARLPDALRIGLGWSIQEFEALPADPWDMPLDAIATEAEWILPATSRILK